MNALYTAIYNLFKATPHNDFYNAVNGLYLHKAPQGTDYPYCVYFPVSATNDLDFTDEKENFLVQFNIFSQSNSASEAGDILGYLKDLYDNCSLNVSGWNPLKFQRDFVIPFNDLEQEPPIYGYSVQYTCLLEKAR